jgi:hypothetical protein
MEKKNNKPNKNCGVQTTKYRSLSFRRGTAKKNIYTNFNRERLC